MFQSSSPYQSHCKDTAVFLFTKTFCYFFSSKVQFFLFSLFGGIWSGFIYPSVIMSYRHNFNPLLSGCFGGWGVYNNYISILKNKNLLVFWFFLAGHFRGAFKGHFRLLGAFSCLTWAFIQGQ